MEWNEMKLQKSENYSNSLLKKTKVLKVRYTEVKKRTDKVVQRKTKNKKLYCTASK